MHCYLVTPSSTELSLTVSYGASHFGENVGVRNAESALSCLQIEIGSDAGSCLTVEHLEHVC